MQLQQAAEKTRQARKAADLKKNIAADEDELEHQVENAEELTEIHDEDHAWEKKRKQQHHEPTPDDTDEKPSDGLDLTA